MMLPINEVLIGDCCEVMKDFPRWWMEAADRCEFCGAKYVVKITSVAEEGYFGEIEWRVYHSKECLNRYDEGTGDELFGEFDEGWDVAGWTLAEKPVDFMGKKFYPITSRGNVGPCLNCGKLVIGVPLILFLNKGHKGQLDFCFSCVKKNGWDQKLLGAPIR